MAETVKSEKNEGCYRRESCVPYGMECSSFYCNQCAHNGYIYYYSKDWDRKNVIKTTSFKDAPHHPTIRDAGGCTFGW